MRGSDPDKDQSYFLWGLPPSLLPRLLFPVGELTKVEVRERARQHELVTADKPESQEICFVPTGDYRDLLKKRLSPLHPALTPGSLVRRSGEVVGEHNGYAGFTVGQRKGLGGGFGEPLYVLEVRAKTREVVVGSHDELFDDVVVVDGLNWLREPPIPTRKKPLKCSRICVASGGCVAANRNGMTISYRRSTAGNWRAFRGLRSSHLSVEASTSFGHQQGSSRIRASKAL